MTAGTTDEQAGYTRPVTVWKGPKWLTRPFLRLAAVLDADKSSTRSVHVYKGPRRLIRAYYWLMAEVTKSDD